jgi:hypothetical protein
VSWKVFGSTHGGNEKAALAALPQKLRDLGVDAVMSGWRVEGSCTPAVLRAVQCAKRRVFPLRR